MLLADQWRGSLLCLDGGFLIDIAREEGRELEYQAEQQSFDHQFVAALLLAAAAALQGRHQVGW